MENSFSYSRFRDESHELNSYSIESKFFMILTLIIAWIVFTILLKVLKTTISTAFTVAAILVLLNLSYGITPQDILQQVTHFAQTVWQMRGIK